MVAVGPSGLSVSVGGESKIARRSGRRWRKGRSLSLPPVQLCLLVLERHTTVSGIVERHTSADLLAQRYW